jgi:excinuclease UvrABC nuclease subunit
MSISNRVFMYTLYDGDGDVLYVGRSSNVANRLRQHHKESLVRPEKAEWFFRTRGIKLSGPYTHDLSLRVERRRIESLLPPGNIAYTPRQVFWTGR